MIQEMTENYFIRLAVGYVTGGIVGWAVWFVLALAYVLWSFKLDLSLYSTEAKGGTKWSMHTILQVIFWPWGIMESTHYLVRHVNKKLSGRKGGGL